MLDDPGKDAITGALARALAARRRPRSTSRAGEGLGW